MRHPVKTNPGKTKRIGFAVSTSIAGLIFFLFLPAGEAGIYSFKDENGKTHYTDDVSKIPEEYREVRKGFRKHKEALKDTDSPPPPALAPVAPVEMPGLPTRGGAVEVPLAPSGNNYLVDVLFNDSVEAKLILDTGASLVDISTEVARKLGYFPGSISVKRTFNTANGAVQHPIVAMPTVKVGNARSVLVDASINDSFEGIDGLLGMSFLGDYKFEIDRSNNLLVLKPLTKGEMEWGGKPGSWWKKRFEFYNKSINDYGRGAKQLRRNRDPRAAEYTNLAEYYQDVKKRLENHARRSGVPEKYR